VVYVTPEMLPYCLSDISALHQRGGVSGREGVGGVGLLAVDEAHCISEWGQDFRAAFMNINCVRNTPCLANIPVMALTATAVPRVRDDIKTSLHMNPNCLESVSSVDRCVVCSTFSCIFHRCEWRSHGIVTLPFALSHRFFCMRTRQEQLGHISGPATRRGND
jgi:hypothetical protein